MPSDNLNSLKAELQLAIQDLEPRIEGLKDFARLNLLPMTVPIVDGVLKAYQRRLDAIKRSLHELEQLEVDQYPALPPVEVTADIYADLQANVATIAAAFAKFTPKAEAASADLVPGAPEPK